MISPWNFPVILSLGDAIPALLAGNAVVIKPSEITPLTLMKIVDAWREEIGAPDVLDVVNGMGDTGGALVDEVDYMQFTGSEKTGKIVMKRAAETLTPVSLELGGKDPMIVTRDADIDRAVNATAWGGLLNTGQICISIERVYVEEPIYDEFVSKLQAKVETLRQGADGDTYSAEVGAMTSPAQIEIVSDQVEDARAAGARILTGGKRIDQAGDWYEPTVIADVDHSMKVMTEETFGPVIPVMKVRDVEEAIQLANDTTLRPRLVGVRRRRRRRRADRAPHRGGPLQRQRRARQLQHPRPADGRLEELRHRRPPRRPGHPSLLPHPSGHEPTPADGEVRAGLVPVQRAQARRGSPPLHVHQRARAQEPSRIQAQVANRSAKTAQLATGGGFP